MRWTKTAIVVVCIFFSLYSLVNHIAAMGTKVEARNNLDPVIKHCLPRDQNEETVFSIEHRVNGNYLSCERHKRVSYAQAVKGKPYRLHLAMDGQ